MLVYASVCAVLLLAGLGEAKNRRPTAYRTINKLVVTNAYSGWNNSPDACFQLGLVPAFISKENRRAAGKAIRNAGKRHAWVYAVRHNGGWVSKRLKMQLPASARKLSNRELKEGEKGEVVEETNADVVHVTLCEKPGSHRRRGYRRHSRGRRHRRHHRHHHGRRGRRDDDSRDRRGRRDDDSRDRRSYSLDRRSEDYGRTRDASSEHRHRSHDRDSVSDDRRGGRRRRDRALRRTGGGWADSQSDTEHHDRRNRRDRGNPRDDQRSYERNDRHGGRRDRDISSDRYGRRRSSYSDDSEDYSGRDSRSDSYDDRRHRHRSRSRRSRRSSKRGDEGKAYHGSKHVGSGSCPAGYDGDPSRCPIQTLLNQSNPRFIPV